MQNDTSYELEIIDYADAKFQKLRKKNKKQLEIINKKITEIRQNPEHYKPLRGDYKGARRVHINKSYVLIFEIEGNVIKILDYDHHDNIY
ncbi:MAG: type II toxin-antitoxin system mRNA interferase toxin, RelE/StbE family [Candidatus Woesearchaeota archaeon]